MRTLTGALMPGERGLLGKRSEGHQAVDVNTEVNFPKLFDVVAIIPAVSLVVSRDVYCWVVWCWDGRQAQVRRHIA